MTNEKSQQLYVGTDSNAVLNRCPNGTGSGTSCVLAVTGLSTSTSSYSTGNILSPNTVYYYSVVSWNSTDCNKYAMAPSLSSCQMSPASLKLQVGQSAQLETLATGVANGTITYSDEGNSVSFDPNQTNTYAFTPVTYVGSVGTGNGGGSSTVTTTLDTNFENVLLVANVTTDSSTRSVRYITTSGLTWTKFSSKASGTDINSELWYAYATNTISNQSTVVTLSSSGKASVVIAEYANTNGASSITNLSQASGTANNSSVQITPEYDGSLVVGTLSVTNDPHVTDGSGFTIINSTHATNNSLTDVADSDNNSTLGTPITTSFTWDANDAYVLSGYEIIPFNPGVQR